MKINTSLVQMDVAPLDKKANIDKICEYIHQESKQGSDLIVFPELANTGYIEPFAPGLAIGLGCENYQDYANQLRIQADAIDGDTINKLVRQSTADNIHIVAGLALYDDQHTGKLFNSSVLIAPNIGVMGVYHKLHLWACEKLYFSTGDAINTHKTDIGHIGMQICYDIRFPEITRIMALQGAQIITNIWASAYPKNSLPSDMHLFHHRSYTRAHENGVFFLSCNQAGEQSSYQFLGRSMVCAPSGNILGVLDHFDETVLQTELDMQNLYDYRNTVSIFTDRRPDVYKKYLL